MLAGVMTSTSTGSVEVKAWGEWFGDGFLGCKLDAIHKEALWEGASRRSPFQPLKPVREVERHEQNKTRFSDFALYDSDLQLSTSTN